MTITYGIDDVELNIVSIETGSLYITLTQDEDVVVLSIDQAREIATIIDEVEQ